MDCCKTGSMRDDSSDLQSGGYYQNLVNLFDLSIFLSYTERESMVGMKKCWRFFPYWADCKYYLWRDLMPQPVWQCTKCFPDQWSGSLFIFLWCYWEKRKKYMATTFLTD